MFYYLHAAKRSGFVSEIWDPDFNCSGSFYKEEGATKQALRKLALTGKYDYIRLYEGMLGTPGKAGSSLKEFQRGSTMILGGEDMYVNVLADPVLSWNWLNGLTEGEQLSPSQDCLWLVKYSVRTSWGNHPYESLDAYISKEDAVSAFAEEVGPDGPYIDYDCVVEGAIEGRRVDLYSVEWEKVVVASPQVPANDSWYSNSELREVIKFRRP